MIIREKNSSIRFLREIQMNILQCILKEKSIFSDRFLLKSAWEHFSEFFGSFPDFFFIFYVSSAHSSR